MTQRRRRNFLRRADRRAFYRARREGERYCSACGRYRVPGEFTGDDLRACDHCRGARHCRRCRQDQPVAEFGDADGWRASDTTCRVCRSYRPLTEGERATLDAFLAGEEPRESPTAERGVALGRDENGRRVRLSAALRTRHVYLVGEPGTGKTTLLKNLAIQDMAAGLGCGVIDLHGDLALDLLGSVPANRLPVVTYFAPATGHGPTFNPLALPYPPATVVDDLVDVLKMFFTTAPPQLEQLLRFGLLTLLGDRAPHTLANLYTFYVAAPYRAALAEASPSPRLRAFWQHEVRAVEPGTLQLIADTLAAFLTPLSPSEQLLSIAENGLDFEALMDGRQIFIANLNAATLGSEPGRLLAALLVRAVARAAGARTIRGSGDFFLYLPGFHEYVTDGFDALLADLTKSQVGLTLAHQRLDELPSEVEDMILSHADTLAVFQVNAADAESLKRHMIARRVVRASTGRLYNHDAVRRAAATPVRARVRELLAQPRVFVDEPQPTYPGSSVDNLLAEVQRVQDVPLPDDLTEIDWPRVTDFTDCKPLTALVRIERSDNVTALTLDPPLPSDANTRTRILERPHRREVQRGHDATSGGAVARVGQTPQRRAGWRRRVRTLRRPRR